MGDLIQTLPLIRVISAQKTVHLVCDYQVQEWAELLPGIETIHTVNTQVWRQRSRDESIEFARVIESLESELGDTRLPSAEKVYPLNEHPVCDLLAQLAGSGDAGRYLTVSLILLRSYLHLLVQNRSWNRVHLGDLWRMALGRQLISPAPVKSSARGMQFAKEIINPLIDNENGHIWAIVLGSGGKYRRMESEIFSQVWSRIPESIRPGLVLIGGKGEQDLAERFLATLECRKNRVLNLVGRCSPDELIGVLEQMQWVIGVDTGPLHWAVATGTKVLGLYFGDAGFRETGPYGDDHLALIPDCPDYPCHPEHAVRCGYQCRQRFSDVNTLSQILQSLIVADDSTSVGAPAGFRLYRSLMAEEGVKYVECQGGNDSEFAIFINSLVRAVFADDRCRVAGPGFHDFEQYSAPHAHLETVESLMTRWIDEVRQLPWMMGIPQKQQETVREMAIARLSETLCEFSFSTMTTTAPVC